MIRRIAIKGYKALIDVELDNLFNLAFLVGKNNSGKSSVLQAIRWYLSIPVVENKILTDSYEIQAENPPWKGASDDTSTSVECWFDCLDDNQIENIFATFDETFNLSNPVKQRLLPHIHTPNLISLRLIYIKGIIRCDRLSWGNLPIYRGIEHLQLREIIQGSGAEYSNAQQAGGKYRDTYSSFFSNLKSQVLRVKREITFEMIPTVRELRTENFDRNVDAALHLLASGQNVQTLLVRYKTVGTPEGLPGQKNFGEITDAFRDLTPDNLELDAYQLSNGEIDTNLRQEESGPRILLSESGTGLEQLLIIITILNRVRFIQKTENRIFFLGIEEPENHFHPELQKNYLSYLKDITGDGLQILATSHSPIVLNNLVDISIYQTKSISQLEATIEPVIDFEGIRSSLGELGINRSDLYQNNVILCVEGNPDKVFLNEISELLAKNGSINFSFSSANVELNSLGGKDNLIKAAQSQLDPGSAKLPIPILFLMDKDESGSIPDKLLEDDRVKVLKKREIENYLITPKLVREWLLIKVENYIKAGKESQKDIPSEKKLDEIILDVAKDLKHHVLTKRVGHLLKKSSLGLPRGQIKDLAESIQTKDELVEGVNEYLISNHKAIDPEKSKGFVENLVLSESKKLSKEWRGENILNIVPGKVVLRNLALKFDLKYNELVDIKRFIKVLKGNPKLINKEITEVVNWILSSSKNSL